GLVLTKPKDLIKLKTFRNNSGEKLSIIVLCPLSIVKSSKMEKNNLNCSLFIVICSLFIK
ncbi:hypothetical protein, partial [Clostridium cochlearium]|uniref:hypothetical protein n=1 Tax=Clostridium cochlearium TaxID=1494 RepID=UPI00241F2B70